jgi:hypothetical protein
MASFAAHRWLGVTTKQLYDLRIKLGVPKK